MTAMAAVVSPALGSRYQPALVSAIMLMLLAWQAAQLVETVRGAGPDPAAQFGGSLPPPDVPRRSSFDVDVIVNAHLFGVTAADEQDTDVTVLATTQMQLVLAGTIAYANPLNGVAIIGGSAATARVYAVGHTIVEGTKLHSVYPDRVTLDRSGRLEALFLPMKFVRAAPDPSSVRGTAGGSMPGEHQRPAAIVEIIQPQPIFANGALQGYLVNPAHDREQTARIGLRPGDIVTAVGGVPLDDPARSMEILHSLDAVAQVAVTVERNGQSVQVTIDNAAVLDEAAITETIPAAVAVAETIDRSEAPELIE
jgi:general secretion pathway protein C